jgi:hypothetical protein
MVSLPLLAVVHSSKIRKIGKEAQNGFEYKILQPTALLDPKNPG